MSILFTQIVRLSDRRVIVSAECPLSRHFESKHKKTIKDMASITEKYAHETQFCNTKASEEGIMVYFKQFVGIVIISAVEVGLSRTSVSLYFERLNSLFVEEYGTDLLDTNTYIRFEDTIQAESKRYSQDKGMEETIDALQETKEVCIKNYSSVIQRGHKIENLEMLGQKLQNVSEKFRKKSRKIHIEAVAAQYMFYIGLVVFLFIVLYLFTRQ
ncbi:vesicle transport protein SEC22 [Nematocida sp. AWRm77]|nr:vesicle transport protein SEC22 [Nematocida sp. AWRm77]